jgi:hypothetical protein
MYVVTAGDGTMKTYTVTVTVAASAAKDITAFVFADSPNAALTMDVIAAINGTAITATVPAGTNVTALVASFTTTGNSVTVGGTPQVAGTTPNNFTNPVMYTVTAADASTKVYTVTVTIAPPASTKDITAFSFTDAANTALSMDVTGSISGTSITVMVPAGTNVSALVATFTTNGMAVKVGSTTQVSGTTPNDFTNPVMYVVTAADGSMKIYTVTVMVGSAATVIPDGDYTWGTWICTTATQTIDIKAFMLSVGIVEVRENVLGTTGSVSAFYTATCERKTVENYVYPSAGKVTETSATNWTCAPSCTAQQCTPGTGPAEVDSYDYTLGTNMFSFSRIYPAGHGPSPASLAGCMPGDVESGTFIKL